MRRTACSRPPISTCASPRESEHERAGNQACQIPVGAGLRSRHRIRNPRPALHPIQDLQPCRHGVRCRTQHPSLRGGSGLARNPAGDEPRRRRAGHRVRPSGGFAHRAAQHLCPQELLLPGPAQGLPDQPVRDPGGSGRRGGLLPGRRKAHGAAGARPPRGGRGKVLARRLHRPERHRSEPRRHAAAGDRDRARYPLQRRSRCLCQGIAQDRDLDRHLRWQHAGRQLPLRRQCVGAQARRPPGHAARDQEPEQFQVHAAGDRLRDPVADRGNRGWPRHPAGHGAL